MLARLAPRPARRAAWGAVLKPEAALFLLQIKVPKRERALGV
jgi:hypothetical protein